MTMPLYDSFQLSLLVSSLTKCDRESKGLKSNVLEDFEYMLALITISKNIKQSTMMPFDIKSSLDFSKHTCSRPI